jgi:hypothetical protein
LGLLYRDQGKLDETKKMYQRALGGNGKQGMEDLSASIDGISNSLST